MTQESLIQRRYSNFVAGLEATPPVECEFSVGDIVTFTNDYGVEFEGHKIIGFAKDTEFYGRFIYLDKDCYWFPSKPENLRHEQPKQG